MQPSSSLESIFSEIILTKNNQTKNVIKRNEIKNLVAKVTVLQTEYENQKETTTNNKKETNVEVSSSPPKKDKQQKEEFENRLEKLAQLKTHSSSNIPELTKVFDQLILLSKTESENFSSSCSSCQKILSTISSSIVEDVTSTLIESLNVVSLQSFSQTQSGDEKISKITNSRKSSAGGWFSVIVDEIILPFSYADEDEENHSNTESSSLLPLSLSRKLESSDFWNDLSQDISCLIRCSKIASRVFSSSSFFKNFSSFTFKS